MNASEYYPDKQSFCNLLSNPFAECYCKNLSSTNICRVLQFCAGEFLSCPIYQKETVITSNTTGILIEKASLGV